MRFLGIVCASACFGFAGAALADGYGFRTPSGNIYCNGSIGGSDISCTIAEKTSGPARPRPAGCSGNWGHTFSMGPRGPVRMECNDWALRKSTYTDVADYGVTGRFADITCRSEKTGLTCRNSDGHGFTLSRRAQKVF